MKIVGIVCEYNPFHLGHAAQIGKIRAQFGQDAAIVCVMSGYFVQRGEPACMDPYARAKAAVGCGADLVLSLPVWKTLSSAEGFARGGVEIMDRLCCVDAISFGCESENADTVLMAARAMESSKFEENLHAAVGTGLSWAAAKQRVLEEMTGTRGILCTPNDILGAEYCRALLRRKSKIEPAPIHRKGSYHDTAPDPENPSATAVRRLLSGGWEAYVPKAAREIFAKAPRYSLAAGERAVLARLRAMTEEEWERTAHGSEGLWRKVMKAVCTENSISEILEASRSKRYPMTRLSRLLMCAYLGLTEEDLQAPVEYSRILAMSETGREVVRHSREAGTITLLNPGEKPQRKESWELERKTADLFTLFCEDFSSAKPGMEQKARISFEKK